MLISVVTPCRLVGRYKCFGETYCFHLQGWILQLQRWRQYVSPKRWYLRTRTHSVTSRKSNIGTVLGDDTHPLWWRCGITFSLLIPHEDHVSPLFLSLERLRQCENIGRKLCDSLLPSPLESPPPPPHTAGALLILYKTVTQCSGEPCAACP
jgi:hypothetical protein